MIVLNFVAFGVTLMTTLFYYASATQTNGTLPYHCTVDVPSESSLSLIKFFGDTVGYQIATVCPQCRSLNPPNLMNSSNHIEIVSLELETFRGLMKLTLDGPCAVLEDRATVLPPKYFDKNSTRDLQYCKQVECIFKGAARRIARFVMAQKCGCDDTCKYTPGKINSPSVPKGQDVTIEYLATQQWISHFTLVRHINAANIR